MVGKRTIGAEDVLPLLSGYDLWPQLMQGIVVDRALRGIDCSQEETEACYQKQIERDAEFLEKRKNRMLLEGVPDEDADFFIRRPVLLEKFKRIRFSSLVDSTFLSMKASLDRVVFCLIRNSNHELMRELFFRLESGEESFASLAPKYSEGRESKTSGQLGPIEMRHLNAALAKVLATAKPGVINPPVVIDGLGVITLLQEKIPARIDEPTRKRILDHLFDEWVKKEVQIYFY